jgi:hypothetical protein
MSAGEEFLWFMLIAMIVVGLIFVLATYMSIGCNSDNFFHRITILKIRKILCNHSWKYYNTITTTLKECTKCGKIK